MSPAFHPSILAFVSLCLTVPTSLTAARVPDLRSGQCRHSSNLVRGGVEARFACDREVSCE